MDRDAYVDIVRELYNAQLRPDSPYAFAQAMADKGVPDHVTLAFLVEIGLAH